MNRRVRIAVSMFFAVLTVLLCVLWVRSYRIGDMVELSCCNSIGLLAESHSGGILASFSDIDYDWVWKTDHVPEDWSDWNSPFPVWELTFDDFATIRFPHWFPVLVCSIVAAVPWAPRNFSLRTMLIATTLIAVLLGFIIWLAS